MSAPEWLDEHHAYLRSDAPARARRAPTSSTSSTTTACTTCRSRWPPPCPSRWSARCTRRRRRGWSPRSRSRRATARVTFAAVSAHTAARVVARDLRRARDPQRRRRRPLAPGPGRRPAGVVRADRAGEGAAPGDRRRRAGRRGRCGSPARSPTARTSSAEIRSAARRGRASSTRGISRTPSSRGSWARRPSALVTPCWDEPYGLVVAEALACGTPVCAFARGALPELLDAGRAAASSRPATSAALAAAIGDVRGALAGGGAPSTRCATCSLERMVDALRRALRGARRCAASRDRLLRPPPGRRARHPRGGDRARTRRRAGLPASARARGPTTGPASGCSSPATTTGPFEARPTAGGALHWAPRGHAGLRERMAQIAAWVADARAAPVRGRRLGRGHRAGPRRWASRPS